MAGALTIVADFTPWTKALDHLDTALVVSGVRAMNKTGATAKVALSRDVAKDMGLNVGTVKDQITVRKATPDRLSCRVVAKGAQIPIYQFKASGNMPSRGRGLGVSYIKQGKRVRVRDAFIARVGTHGHIGVFRRLGQSERRSAGSWGLNLPIVELKGASIAHVFGKQVESSGDRWVPILAKNLEHEVSFELARLKA